MQSSGAKSVEVGRKQQSTLKNSRRRVRQKVHLPAHAGLTNTLADKGFDVIEILDLTEDGGCIQTSIPLKPNSMLTLSLDLMETNGFVSTPAVVIWSDKRGRNGVHFTEISEASRQQLRKWLATHAAASGESEPENVGPTELGPRPVRTPTSSRPERWESVRRESVRRESVRQSPEQTRAALAASSKEPDLFVPADYSSVLSALVAVKREVELTGADLSKALQLLASRALSLTHASGAAIALARNSAAEEMICQARAGSDAPGLGAKLQVGSGFSGECVRKGKTLRCDDAETDSRVDREGCRMLGIRSILATPVRRNDSVLGILEVFSPDARSFSSNEEKTLERLAHMVGVSLERAETARSETEREEAERANVGDARVTPAATTIAAVVSPTQTLQAGQLPAQFRIPAQIEKLIDAPSSPLRKWLPVALGIIVVVAVLLWLIVSGTLFRNGSRTQRQSSAQQDAKTQGSAILQTSSLEKLRQLAVNGDPNAQFDLGARYATGEDVQQDYAESVRWFTQAAEQGHVIAQATLGAYYWAGRGIPQDLGRALFWSVIAQAGGDQASKYRVTVLEARMSHAQVVAARQQAGAWLKKHEVSGKPSE
ncbi:MAG TPA: GAF domain-containing protein [Terriglobales bacterium]|jgi:putative methionine-R-sulfoxide reductase with GAF domain|nr:GAF domain-containing protein [Terriglobales bacterium]